MMARSALAAQDGSSAWADTAGSLARDLAYLAADAMDGRGTGTPGNRRAALFIARRYNALGLLPVFPDSGCGSAAACGSIFFQSFRPPPDILIRHKLSPEIVAQNVAALMPGSDPMLRREVVVVGADYDHIRRACQ